METDPVRHRDKGLRRASAITRWVAAASAGAAALFAVLAAHPSVHASGTARVSTDQGSSTSTDDGTVGPDQSSVDPGNSGSDAVVPPPAPPVRSRSQPQVVTGSS